MKRNFTVRRGALDGVEAFLAVAEHRSFRRAAAELGVTPSAISQGIRALEWHVGAALFIQADMIALRLSPPFPLIVVGSPDYLSRRGRPQAIADLRDHSCLRLRRSNGSIASWTFRDGNQGVEAVVSGPLIASDFPTLVGAATEGLGLAQVPEPVALG